MGFLDSLMPKEYKNAKLNLEYYHVCGLPVPENAKCKLTVFPDNLRFKYQDSKYVLPFSQIISMYTNTYTKEEMQTKSSFLKAAAGAALFGLPGAFIGALPESKLVKKDSTFLTIQYSDNQNKNAYIVFNVSEFPEWADKLIAACNFKNASKENKTVWL